MLLVGNDSLKDIVTKAVQQAGYLKTTLYITNNSETRSTGITKTTAIAQINNTSSQQITNDNSNNTNNSAQRLTVDQLAIKTRLQIDSSFALYLYLSDRMRRHIEISRRYSISPFLVEIGPKF
ncbi:hypothetical protein AVEN_257599-1 [Araneus ventricosus]|uniref:Uncharacterized protein n=1 Tax=Araneus ventricosus TaxID=182803 RepID=A0A4Y2XA80_ARAVE|nr:hypothetical protein AVEN_247862-1 [Araneus ventricosus]GBO46511.1 hypothetical protein AVEN_257599-1 [Araneus ventricosus]